MTKNSLVLGTVIAAALSSGFAQADVTANAGIVSDYYFRGVKQTGSASANGGVDYEHKSGFSAGVWVADVEGQAPVGSAPAGIEIDTYASYGGEVSDMSYSIGYTHYGYTGSFDTAYNEVNLGAGYGDFSLDVAIGTHDSATSGTPDDDYTFAKLSYAKGPFAASYGAFGGDWGGSYIEVGLSTDIGGADAGISVINGNPEENFTGIGANTTDGTAVVFSLSKSFAL